MDERRPARNRIVPAQCVELTGDERKWTGMMRSGRLKTCMLAGILEKLRSRSSIRLYDGGMIRAAGRKSTGEREAIQHPHGDKRQRGSELKRSQMFRPYVISNGFSSRRRLNPDRTAIRL